MPESVKISLLQLAYIIIGSRLVIDLTFNFAFFTPPANQDVWISTLLSFFISLVFVMPILALAKKYPDKTIIQYSQILLGKFLGKLVGILYIGFFLHVTVNTIRLFGEYFTAAPMPETPLLVFLCTMVLVSAYAVHNGLEVIARFGEIIMPITIILVLLIAAFVFGMTDLNLLKPVLEEGILPVLQGAVHAAARTTEPIFIAMLCPYLNVRKKMTLSFIAALAGVILLLAVINMQIISTFGNQAKLLSFPYVSLLREISFADIIERIDLLHIGIWILGNIFKASLYFYLTVLGLAQLFNLKSYQILVLPVAFSIVLLSVFLYKNLIQLKEFLFYKILTPYNLFFILAVPLLLMIISFLKKKTRPG